MKRTTNLTAGIAICGLLAFVDVVGLAGIGAEDAPPLVVLVVGAVLGLVTLGALRPALRGSRMPLLTVIVSRGLSALLGLPVFLVDDAPNWAKIATAITLVLTAAGVALLTPAAGHQHAARAA